jgi:hypothetical protein
MSQRCLSPGSPGTSSLATEKKPEQQIKEFICSLDLLPAGRQVCLLLDQAKSRAKSPQATEKKQNV